MASHHFPRKPQPSILACRDKTQREEEIGKLISRVTKQPQPIESSLKRLEEDEEEFEKHVRSIVLPPVKDPIGIPEESKAELTSDVIVRSPALQQSFFVKYSLTPSLVTTTGHSFSQDNSTSMDTSSIR